MFRTIVTMSPSDLACLDKGNCIMRSVIKLARQCQRFNVSWAIENSEKSLFWMTSQLQDLSKMRSVQKMIFDFCAFGTKWRKRTSVLAGHENWANVWSWANNAVLLVKNICNASAMTPLVNFRVYTQTEYIR